MKKRRGTQILVLLLLLSITFLTACNGVKPELPTESEKTESGTVGIITETEEITAPATEPNPTEPSTPKPVVGEPYRIDYLKDEPCVGRCTAQLILNPDWTEAFTVEIPEKSPDGDTITHFRRWHSDCFIGYSVPRLISEKTYQEAILKPLKEAAARGETEQYYVNKVDAFFQLKNPLGCKTEEEKKNLISFYPITDPEGANVPIRAFSNDANMEEILFIQECLDKYTSFTKETMRADYSYIRGKILESKLTEKLGSSFLLNFLSEFQYWENDHLVGITFPDTAFWMQASDWVGYEKLMEFENGVYYIGNWAIHTNGNLDSVTFREGTVGIASGTHSFLYGRCFWSGLKNFTFPTSLKVICDLILSHNDEVEHKIFISDIVSWCNVQCISWTGGFAQSYGGGAFNCYYELYLNGVLLTELVIPDNMTEIKASDFYKYLSLKKVTIPASVKEIGEGAFCLCRNLTSITIQNGVQRIGADAFMDCKEIIEITIPNSVIYIGFNAFRGCKNLISVETGVSYVDRWVVDCDDSVTQVELRENTIGIGVSAFSNCVILTSICIPNSVKSIGNKAFRWCVGLTNITIPENVTNIGECAFSSCDNLSSITVSEGNPIYHSAGNCLIETKSKTLIAGCKNSIIPTDGSVEIIGDSAFYYCSGLTNIIIPNGVKAIATYAFLGCSELTSLMIPDSVVTLGSYAFDDNLKTITFFGTQTQWIALVGESSGEYSSIKIICSDATIEPID